VLIAVSTASTLDDELDKLRLDVRNALMLELARRSAASTLEEELDRLRLEV